MAYQKQDRKYINSVFLKKAWGSGDSILINVGVKREELIEDLKKLPINERGFVNLTIGTHKDDSDKFSLWFEESKNSNSSSKSTPPKSSTTSSSTPQSKQTVEPSSTDDLPF
jgi:hypothetical protein